MDSEALPSSAQERIMVDVVQPTYASGGRRRASIDRSTDVHIFWVRLTQSVMNRGTTAAATRMLKINGIMHETARCSRLVF